MSIALQTEVWKLDLSSDLQFVLLALADHAHDDGTSCKPGIEYLAWKLGASERTVQRQLRRLEELGVIVAVGYASGGRGHVTEYQIVVDAVPQKKPYARQPGEGQTHLTPRSAPVLTGRDRQIIAGRSEAALKGDTGGLKGDTGGEQRVTDPEIKGDKFALKGDKFGLKGDTVDEPTIREPVEPNNRATEPGPESSASRRPPKNLSLAPIADAFRAAGLAAPVFLKSEISAAQMLLSVYGADLIAQCWAEVEAGTWGDQFARDNLSFRYLLANNRLRNWQRQREEGAARGTPSNRNERNANEARRRSEPVRGGADSGPDWSKLYRSRVVRSSDSGGIREDGADDSGPVAGAGTMPGM